MNNNTSTPVLSKIITFAHAPGAPEHQHSSSAGSASQRIAETLLSNPRFSTPANDQPGLPKLAPRDRNCRQAKLLSLWMEILVEDELAIR